MDLLCPLVTEAPINRSFFGEGGTNPLIRILNLPEATVCLAVIAENPVSHKIKWVVYNIPATDTIEENLRKGIEAVKDFSHEHLPDQQQGEIERWMTYFVYALDDVLNIGGGKDGPFILNAMKNHILKKAEITIIFGTPPATVGAFPSYINSGFPLGKHD